ncbi:MAG: hypothetical protein KAS53_03085 [Candidatus Cloacimonetes bacterium]|nr:hypothetical protein [Candidatus Cloacimonadota bacterium]
MKKYLLVLIIVFVFGSLAFGQTNPQFVNVGLANTSGSGGGSTGAGQTVYVQALGNGLGGVLQAGIHDNGSSQNDKLYIYYYSDSPPSTYQTYKEVDASSFSTSTNTLTFQFIMPGEDANTSGALSIEIYFGLVAHQSFPPPPTTNYGFGELSYSGVNNAPTNYYSYLTYSTDTSTEAPTLDLPLANATVGEDISVQYDQPETAYPSTVKLTFTRTAGTADPNSPYILEVTSEASGTDKTLAIDGSNLAGSPGISSVSGGNVLVDNAIYTIKIEYQDLAQNAAASDQNAGITYDGSAALQASGGDYNAGTSFAPGSQDNAFFRLKMENTGSGTKYIDKIIIHMLGTFDASDIDLIEVWRSTDDTFGSDTSIGSGNPDVFDEIEFDFSPDEGISSSSPTWYFFTIDVDSGASGTDEIGLEIEVGGIIALGGVTVVGLPISGSTHPLPVTLSSFTVVLSGRPVIYWTTQSETNNAYWNIYRGISQNMGQAIQINYGDLIPGQGTVTEPTDYSYIDNYPIVENTTYWYWLECIDNAGEADILGPVSLFIPEGGGNNGTPATPDDYGLKQNFPNPFNPDTKINFALVEDSPVRLTIYNIKGEKIKTIFKDFVPADMVQTAYWDGKDGNGKRVASGVYLYRLRTNKTEFNKRMLLMK